jgi:SpoVK/Ycf46/Vps4 family AAA+-type ATPase
MFAVLGEPELLQAFGARSVWQLIERVQQQELGGARNLARYRSQASAGSRIFDWLAATSGSAGAGGTAKDDAGLVEAVERLLAAMSAAAPAAGADALLAAVRGEGAAGVAALLVGAPGTGKTLAAHVLASALNLPIFRIDLSRVVSKYIGETEKNLDAVFERAAQQDAVLFLDEADALFGRRTEVKDSHDRYANAAIDYLLQRLEEYEGALILATNLKENIDAAFARRPWRVLRFPWPKE